MYSYSYSDKYIKLDHKQKDIGAYQCKHLYKVLEGCFHYHGYIRIQKENGIYGLRCQKRATLYNCDQQVRSAPLTELRREDLFAMPELAGRSRHQELWRRKKTSLQGHSHLQDHFQRIPGGQVEVVVERVDVPYTLELLSKGW